MFVYLTTTNMVLIQTISKTWLDIGGIWATGVDFDFVWKWGWNQPLCSNHNNLLKHYDDFMSHYSNTILLVIHTYAALRACNLFPQTRLVVHVRVLGNCIKTSWAITKEEYNIAKNEKTPFTTLTEISNQCTMDISCLTIASPWPLWKEMHKAWEIDYLGSL